MTCNIVHQILAYCKPTNRWYKVSKDGANLLYPMSHCDNLIKCGMRPCGKSPVVPAVSSMEINRSKTVGILVIPLLWENSDIISRWPPTPVWGSALFVQWSAVTHSHLAVSQPVYFGTAGLHYCKAINHCVVRVYSEEAAYLLFMLVLGCSPDF